MTFGLRTGVAAALLIALLTWLLLKGSDSTEAEYLRVQRTLKVIAFEQSLLRNDVLRARAGLLHNYDPLNHHIKAMRDAVDELAALGEAVATGPGQQIAAAVEAQSTLVEDFKTNNAILQNSLAYFDLLSARASAPGADPQLAATVGALASVITHLARDGSHDVVYDVERRLDVLAGTPATGDALADRVSLVAHGRVLAEVIPKVDVILKRMPTRSTAPGQMAFLRAATARWMAGERRAGHYRIVLYGVALGLLGLLLRVNSQLRALATRVGDRAEIEHVIGQASSQFIGAEPEGIEARLGDALRIMGEGVGADRCYLLHMGSPRRVSLWAGAGREPGPNWPDTLFDVLDPPTGDGRLDLWDRDKATAPKLRSALAATDVAHWCGAWLLDDGQPVGFLGFDGREGAPAPFANSPGLLGVAANVVGSALRQQRMVEQRNALEAKLERARRLETVGTFTSGVAHNFNNVLNVMLGHAEIASDGLPPDSPHRRNVTTILQAGERAREIVSQILDFGRRGQAARHRTRFNTILAETLAHLRTAADPVAVTREGDAGDALVRGEPAQLQQVIVNLIRNAQQASPPGSSVHVRLDRAAVEEARAFSHGQLEPGDYLRLGVTDRGAGMSPEIQAMIFEPFFTTKPEGTGLGLATVREIVGDSGGTVDVRSDPGRGSTFEVWLPVAGEGPRASMGRGASVMVVVADREVLLRDEDILAALGCEPVGFTDPDAALAALRRDPQRFSAIIVERTLPGTTGWRFAQAAGKTAALPIIVSLAAGENGDAGQANAAAIAEVIRRPWQSGVLASVVGRYTGTASTDAPGEDDLVSL